MAQSSRLTVSPSERDEAQDGQRVARKAWARREHCRRRARRRAIAERLATADPGNAGWQRDLIVSCVKLSEVEPSRARSWLTRALGIARDLAASGRLAPVDAWMPDDIERRLRQAGD